ncbi:hypothetical protein RUM43_012011, partial [Polyplax serrata]
MVGPRVVKTDFTSTNLVIPTSGQRSFGRDIGNYKHEKSSETLQEMHWVDQS